MAQPVAALDLHFTFFLTIVYLFLSYLNIKIYMYKKKIKYNIKWYIINTHTLIKQNKKND